MSEVIVVPQTTGTAKTEGVKATENRLDDMIRRTNPAVPELQLTV